MVKVTKILVSQPRPMTEHNPYSNMEEHYGVHFDFQQLIHLEGLDAHDFRQQRINPLDYTAVILNSKMAADQYFRMCEELRLQVPDSMHYYCISEAIANYLQKYIQFRKRKVFFCENNRLEDLLPTMNRRPNEKYLLVASDVHNDDLVTRMAEHKIIIQPAIFYRTVATEWPQDQPFDYQMIVLFTPSGVLSIRKNFPDWQQGDTVIACFGQSTCNAAEELGFRVDIKAPSENCPSITIAIDKYLENNQ